MPVVPHMKPKELLAPKSIAFYNEDHRYRPFSSNISSPDHIDIFAYGPWKKPCEDSAIFARYVIGHSKQGYHWDTEFIIGAEVSLPQQGAPAADSHCQKFNRREFNWSPACTFTDLAIKHARRCIAIQIKNINLDKTTKIKLSLEPGQVSYIDIDKVFMHKRLAYSVDKKDLQRLALYNGYLSWSEYENGTLDFSLA